MPQLIEALDRVQAATATYFALPSGFTPNDVEAIFAGDRLLFGEAVAISWNSLVLAIGAQEGIEALISVGPGPQRFAVVLPNYTITVSGHAMNLGQYELVLHQSVMDNVAELQVAGPLGPGQEAKVRMVPAAVNSGEVRLTAG